MNYEDSTDQELSDIIQAVSDVQAKRSTVVIAESQSREAVRNYREAVPREQVAEWTPPLRPVDAYFTGDLVTIDEVTYESQRDFNYLKPGEDAAAWSPQSEF